MKKSIAGMPTKSKLITGANFQDFDWNKAKLFYHVAKCGSILKAARLANLDPTSLTRQIQSLEKQMGHGLIIRKTGVGVINLTRKGEELLENIAPFFLKMKGFCGHSYVEVDGEKKRKIRIVTTHAVASFIIGDIILDYNRSNPQLVFEIVGEDHSIDLILRDADVAIRPYDPDTQGIQQEHLFTLEKKLYTSQAYLDKYGEPKSVHDLKKHRLIVTASNPKDYPYADIHWILKLGMALGKKHTPIFLSNSIDCMVSAAEKGIGIIGSYELMTIIKKSNLINILPDVSDKLLDDYFIYPDALKEDSDIIDLKNYLLQHLSSSRDNQKTIN